jgi:hypothetical protein
MPSRIAMTNLRLILTCLGDSAASGTPYPNPRMEDPGILTFASHNLWTISVPRNYEE